MSRKQAINRKRYEALEPRYKWFYQGDLCYYCGIPADTVDHVPAISAAYAYGVEKLNERGYELLKVSSCRECNFLLGDKSLFNLTSRVKYIYNRLKTRYQNFLYSPEWDFDELGELGPTLQTYIKSCGDTKFFAERRLQFIESVFEYV